MSTTPPPDPTTSTFPWHHLPHTFPTTQLPQRFASRPQPKPKPHLKPTHPKAPPDPRAHQEELEREHIRTLKSADEKCPLYELVQYKCEVDLGPGGEGEGKGKIKCRPVVRLFRRCKAVMVEVTELEKYQGYT